jgi:thioredoxin-related protein
MFTNVERTKICGFSVTMYRDGSTDEELLNGIDKMEASRIYTLEPNNSTTFTYRLKSEQNQIATRKGIDNFKQNIIPTLLFCQELKKIRLIDHGNTLNYVRLQTIKLVNGIFKSEFETEDVKQSTKEKRWFIHTSINQKNAKLTNKFRKDRLLRLTAAIETDDSQNLLQQERETPSHFCVFPLIGSENHLMPILLNSPDFEPDAEREFLLLEGVDKEKNVISDAGINKMILKESISLYERLVKYLSQSHHNLFLLSKGLKDVPHVPRYFNSNWFLNKIIFLTEKYYQSIQ